MSNSDWSNHWWYWRFSVWMEQLPKERLHPVHRGLFCNGWQYDVPCNCWGSAATSNRSGWFIKSSGILDAESRQTLPTLRIRRKLLSLDLQRWPQALQQFRQRGSHASQCLRTICQDTGSSIVEAYYGVPKDLYDTAVPYLDEPLKQILFVFESVFGSNLQAEWIFFYVWLRFQKTDAENRNLHRLFCRNDRIFAKTL